MVILFSRRFLRNFFFLRRNNQSTQFGKLMRPVQKPLRVCDGFILFNVVFSEREKKLGVLAGCEIMGKYNFYQTWNMHNTTYFSTWVSPRSAILEWQRT